MTFVLVSPGRSLGIDVYWAVVQGAETYVVRTTAGQNCSLTVNSHCYITPVECGQNQSVTVKAYNSAGSSEASQPVDFITCGYITQTDTRFNLYASPFLVFILLVKQWNQNKHI